MNGLIPLSMVDGSKEVTVVAINAGRGLQARLFSLGLIPGVTIKVLSNSRPGPVRISIKDTRLALGWGVAQKIIVSE
ncbi:Ferrous iron transporter, FeoA subunit domain protein [Candidatus Desulfofervidus auxilii]|uniref:Ferrous iron transport protein A n=1 Tax=Desulfofervidus auxilii TaxID=1621989 RepID=A0A7C1ZP72_DESA2|nr:FeoA family protein [Candidatus Desulfofervidus auxilii]AMM41268.1 Ferrous iron transporter, FeoA subunit domain protein [Candidatus Desulfofervidus auxilii]HEC68327.1 ferrous iron transport protein A [Candidatus Desulfofervidus auxilii]